MMFPVNRKIIAVAIFVCLTAFSFAQDPGPKTRSAFPEKSEAKPFRILTNGQRITVQSNRDISKVIVWTAGGNRFVEQTNIDAPSYNFTIPSKEKFVFLMIQLADGKRYTEKIGVL